MLWCKERNVWIYISHKPCKLNIEGDKTSREFKDDIEWSLDPTLFNMLTDKWGKPCIDLFASRLNFKVQKYGSWKPDPSATAIDTFTLDWSCYNLISSIIGGGQGGGQLVPPQKIRRKNLLCQE